MTTEHKYDKYYRCFAAIDLSAIEKNLAEIRKCLNPGVKALAIVKADAYGHGSVPVAKTIENAIDYFGVASAEEAIILREEGIKKPVLVLSYTEPWQYGKLAELDITATIYNLNEAKALSEAALKAGKKIKVHVAVDTGMGRIGLSPDEKGADTAKEISLLEGIYIEGLFSHYACADWADQTYTEMQTELFDKFIDMLKEREIFPEIKHICNSAGTVGRSKQYDMCRLGIMLYGLYPSPEIDKNKLRLIPAMEVVSHVVHVKTVPAGFKVGYGHVYTAPAERKIATVCIGYADGYNRNFTGRGYVLIRGKKAAVLGTVCMDMIMVDVTDIEDVVVGDHVIILGRSEGAQITAEDLGAMSYSFNYEVICNFMPRVTRVYYKNGELIG